MKYLENYKIFEGESEDDKITILIKDLFIEVEDMGISSQFKRLEVGEKYIYDIFSEKNESLLEVYDIGNVSDLDILDENLETLVKIKNIMKDIIARLITSGLYLGSFEINETNGNFNSHLRLFINKDYTPVKNFKYDDREAYYEDDGIEDGFV